MLAARATWNQPFHMTLWRLALRELGYTSSVSREQGLRELREDHAAAAAAASK